MANQSGFPFFIDVDDDVSSPSLSVADVNEPIDLRTPSPASENAASDATTIPLPLPAIPLASKLDILKLNDEMRRNSSDLRLLLRELITSSAEQHLQTTNVLKSLLELTRQASQTGDGYPPASQNATPLFKIKKPVDVSDPSNSADSKSARLPKRPAAVNFGTSSEYFRSNTAARRTPTVTKIHASKKYDTADTSENNGDDLETEDKEDDPETDDQDEDQQSDASTHSTTSRPGMALFNSLVTQRQKLLDISRNRYPHVSTVYAPLDETKYTLSKNSISAVVKWYAKLSTYVKEGGSKHYCDLISPRIAEAIQRKCSITPERFYSLSSKATIDYLFAFIRPCTSLEWSAHFRACLPYPAYSQSFLNQQTLLMKLDDLAKFTDDTLDLIFVLGDYASPPDRDIRKLFLDMVPDTVRGMIKDFSIDIRLPFLKFLPSLKDHIAVNSDVQRAAVPLQHHYSCNVMRAPNSPGFQAFAAYNAAVARSERQIRPSTYEQRARLNVLTADDIYGPGEEQDTEPESTLSEHETQILEDHGIYAFVPPAPANTKKYAQIKKEINYPPHLRFPEGPRPCWTFYNSGTCANRASCLYEHDVPRIEAHIAIKKQRDSYVPSN